MGAHLVFFVALGSFSLKLPPGVKDDAWGGKQERIFNLIAGAGMTLAVGLLGKEAEGHKVRENWRGVGYLQALSRRRAFSLSGPGAQKIPPGPGGQDPCQGGRRGASAHAEPTGSRVGWLRRARAPSHAQLLH